MTESDHNSEKEAERNRAFTLVAERIANSKATVETDPFTSTSPHPDDSKYGLHKRTKSGDKPHNEDSYSNIFSEDKGVLRAFKDGEDPTENKQIPLASNAVTNDTDAVHGTKPGLKRALVEQDFEEIKEVDEYNDSYDARRFNEQLHSEPTKREDEFDKIPEKLNIDLKQSKSPSKHYKLKEEDLEVQNTQEDIPEDEEEQPPIMVDHKFCTQCKLEQPLRTKHCKSCKK